MLIDVFVVIFVTSILVGFSGALAPGPVTAINVRDSIIDGPKVGVFLSTGHAICELLIVCVLLIGISPFVSYGPVRIIIGILGGAFLLYLSVKGITSRSSLPTLADARTLSANRSVSYIYKGFVVSLCNPYFLLWWSTIGLNYILWSYLYGVIGIICFYIGHIMSDYIWNCTLSLGVHHGKRLMTERIYRLIMLVLNGFIGVLGLYFIYGSGVMILRL